MLSDDEQVPIQLTGSGPKSAARRLAVENCVPPEITRRRIRFIHTFASLRIGGNTLGPGDIGCEQASSSRDVCSLRHTLSSARRQYMNRMGADPNTTWERLVAIESIKFIKNVGRFGKTAGGNLQFERLTLIHADNGRGKSTIAAILRSLGSGDSNPILERHRLGADEPPHVVIDCGELAVFRNGTWSESEPGIRVFDDQFVDENVYSGLEVESVHRKNLHAWIIGSKGVRLNRELSALVAKNSAHNDRLREIESEIPPSVLDGLNMDDFCALEPIPDVEESIAELERRQAALDDQERIMTFPSFDPLSIHTFSISELETLLAEGLPTIDEAALLRVAEHCSQIGQGAERWISEGMGFLGSGDAGTRSNCPFCGEPLDGVVLVQHYRSYFNAEYAALKNRIETALGGHRDVLSSDALSGFERGAPLLRERAGFWARYCDVPDTTLDAQPIATCWTTLHSAITKQLQDKQNRPLDQIELSDDVRRGAAALAIHANVIRALNERIGSVNAEISRIKGDVQAEDRSVLDKEIARSKRIRKRHSPEIALMCDQYATQSRAKRQTERKRRRVRQEFSEERRNAFGEYSKILNGYLSEFNADFRIEELQFTNPGGIPSSNYHLMVNECAVPLTAAETLEGASILAEFRNTLSSGDRRTLALAVYFAALDRESDGEGSIAVVDDPAASLDDHRSVATAQAIVALAGRVSQVIVMSHNRDFLGRVFRLKGDLHCAQLQISDKGARSGMEPWDVTVALQAVHDLRHERFTAFLDGGTDDLIGVAQCIRLHLETFLGVVAPADFPPGTTLGSFVEKCKLRLAEGNPILDAPRIEELRKLNEYSREFHHSGESDWKPPKAYRTELGGFIRRTMAFAHL